MFEQSDSERGSANRHNPNRSEILKHYLDVIDSEESYRKAAQRRAALHDEIGNDRDAIMEGSNARFNKVKYSNPYEDESDKYKSYKYGYCIHGGRRLVSIGESLLRDAALVSEELDEEAKNELVDMYNKAGLIKKEYKLYIGKFKEIATLLEEDNISVDQLEQEVTSCMNSIKYLGTLLEESNKRIDGKDHEHKTR